MKKIKQQLIKDFKAQKQITFSSTEYRKYSKELSDLEKEGLITYFKMTHGLCEGQDSLVTFKWN